MTEQDADGLIIAAAFDTARRETVSQAVEFQVSYAQVRHETFVVVPVGLGFERFLIIAQKEILRIGHPGQGADQPDHLPEKDLRECNWSDRRLRPGPSGQTH